MRRSEQKEASLQRILNAGAARLRTEGLAGAAIVPLMQEAGLTHGAFYSHFANKDELAVAAFRHALLENRPRWIGAPRQESWAARLMRLARRYLTRNHRDDLADSCALAALASDAARGSPAFRAGYAEELRKSLAAVCGAEIEPGARRDDAIAFMALCIGGLSLARAVDDPAFSETILAACRNAAGRLASPEAGLSETSTGKGEPS